MDSLPEVCQYLCDEHVRETDTDVLKIHLETLFLLSTRGGGEGKRLVREGGTYAVVREVHLEVEDEGVRRGCERLVDVLMGDEGVGGSREGGNGEGKVGGVVVGDTGGGAVGRMVTADANGDKNNGHGKMVTQAGGDGEDDDDDDDDIVPIF